MSRNDDLWLKELLDDEPLTDDGFSARVVARLEREQRRRRSVLLSVVTLSSLVVLGFLIPSDLSWLSRLTSDGWQVLALVCGFGLGGALWVDTEPVRLPT